MNEIQQIRQRILERYRRDPKIRINVSIAKPRLHLNDVPVEITGVYANIFQIEETSSDAGKTAFFHYPNLEYACADGMGFLALDTKGDLARNHRILISKGDILCYTALIRLEMSRNVQSGNTQNLKSMVIQRSFPKWSVAERRKTAAASDQAAVCACAHSRYFAGGSPSGLRV